MKRFRLRNLFVTAAALALLAGSGSFSAPADAATPLHLRLEASQPGAGETVATLDEIRLEFSQAPQMAGTRIRVLSGGEPLDLGDAAASPDDDEVVVLALADGLADGEYEVRWRAMSPDGHPVTGDFGFTVSAGGR
ncbi:MAG: copper resistance protein CopC [Gemmatimonadetes bacterium]|nr:copper resistance protein CopC [Gemmatimonadota bacterium]